MNKPRSKAVPFTKASACGNDFLIIDFRNAPDDMMAFTRQVCDRQKGMGADGVEWLYPPDTEDADIEAILFNADGSEAEISGNGTRCVAAFRVSKYGGSSIRIQTGAGIKQCELISANGSDYEFEMDMGKPKPGEELTLDLPSGRVKGMRFSMGNPQFVVFVDDFNFDWKKTGSEIQAHSIFPRSTNVDFVHVIDRNTIECRFFERGAGATQSSGTGSCASALAAITAGWAESPVAVVAEGGTQQVRLQEGLILRGPAQLICSGVIFG